MLQAVGVEVLVGMGRRLRRLSLRGWLGRLRVVLGICLPLLGLWCLRWFEGVSVIGSFGVLLCRRWSRKRGLRRQVPDMRGVNWSLSC